MTAELKGRGKGCGGHDVLEGVGVENRYGLTG